LEVDYESITCGTWCTIPLYRIGVNLVSYVFLNGFDLIGDEIKEGINTIGHHFYSGLEADY